MRKILATLILGAACGHFPAAPAAGLTPDFDCAKATTAVERMICGDAGLAHLDRQLGDAYRAVQLSLGMAGTCLRDDQRRWLREVRNRCTDADCLERVYHRRFSEWSLQLAPGQMPEREEPLPDAFVADALLAMMIPPVAAPSDRPATLVQEVGRLCDSGGAYAVASECRYGDDDGEEGLSGALLSPVQVFIDGGNEQGDWERLAMLAAATDAQGMPWRYRVRGARLHEFGSASVPQLDATRCVTIHRLR